MHENETDVRYVIDGGCILVTGGTLIGAAQTGPGQIRGSGISGGEELQIGKGDFIRIPTGVPHWIRKIEVEAVCATRISRFTHLVQEGINTEGPSALEKL